MKMLFLLAVLVAGCGGPSAGIQLSESWPTETADYDAVTAAWTRKGTLHNSIADGYEVIGDVQATFRSPAWRVAYVERVARTQLLSPEAKAALLAEQKKEHAAGYVFEVMLATHDFRTNDLQKGEDSVWRVELMNGRGETVLATDIDSDRRPREIIEALYPLGDFHEPYIVTFPREIELLYSGAETMVLTLSSAQGAIRLVWQPEG